MGEAISEMPAQASETVTPTVGLMVLAAMVPLLGVIILAAGRLGLQNGWAAFLFLFYWTGFRGGRNGEFAPALIGMLSGVALGWLFRQMPATMGAAGYVLPAALMAFSIFCLMCGWLPLLFNYGFMLMIFIATIPVVLASTDFVDVALCTVLGAAWFGGLKLVALWWTVWKTKAVPA